MDYPRKQETLYIGLVLLALLFFCAGHYVVDSRRLGGFLGGFNQAAALGFWSLLAPLAVALMGLVLAFLTGVQRRWRFFSGLWLAGALGGFVGGMVALYEYPMPWSDYRRAPAWLSAEVRRLESHWRADPTQAPWYRFRQAPGELLSLQLSFARTSARGDSDYPATVYFSAVFDDLTKVRGSFEARRAAAPLLRSVRVVVDREPGRFVEALETQWLDFDGDGRANGLKLRVVPSDAAILSRTRLSAWLEDREGKRVSASRAMNFQTGPWEQFFAASDLSASSTPWGLNVRFLGPEEGDFSFVLLNLATLSPDGAELDGAHTRILPTLLEKPIDEDGNALFEALALTFELEVSFPGSYPLMADLQADGQTIATASRRFLFDTSGRHHATLRFEGKHLRAAPTDGPWSVTSVQSYYDGYRQVQGTTAAIHLGEFGKTAPWRREQFEGGN